MIQRCKCNEILGTAISFQDGMTAKVLVYCFGSTYEGTQTHGMNSDVDQVGVLNLPVVNECSETHDKESLLIIQDPTTPYGYAKLQQVKNNVALTIQDVQPKDDSKTANSGDRKTLPTAKVDDVKTPSNANSEDIINPIEGKTTSFGNVINPTNTEDKIASSEDIKTPIKNDKGKTASFENVLNPPAAEGIETVSFVDVKTSPNVECKTIGFGDNLCKAVTETSFDSQNRAVMKLKTIPSKDLFDEKKGPALKWHRQPGMLEQDYVFAFRSNDLPEYTSEWLNRDRKSGWPDAAMLEACQTMGCLFVHKGHPHSDEQDLQWRISFSHQERMIVTSFNSVQLKCFILLKLFKKEIIPYFIKEESITSHHCKTCMLYLIENTPAEFWTPDNLLSCFISCLKLLAVWVEQGNCPNYFLPRENMFEGKIYGDLQADLYETLQKLLSADCSFLVSIKCDKLGQSLIQSCIPRLYTKEIKPRITDIHKLEIWGALVLDLSKIRHVFLYLNYHSSLEVCLKKMLNAIQNFITTKRITEHTTEETKRAISLILPFIQHSITANCLALKVNQGESGSLLWNYLSSDVWNEKGTSSDTVSLKLKQATFMHMLGYHSASLHILRNVEKRKFYTVCYCYLRQETFPGTNELLDAIPKDENITPEYLLNTLLTPCVVFLPTEIDITPRPLVYEMTRLFGMSDPGGFGTKWYDWAVVDPKVLLYFLRYLNHKKLGMTGSVEADIENMLCVINQRLEHISHLETALNLLGWIYRQENMNNKALGCLHQSLDIKPTHNAAMLQLFQLEVEKECLRRATNFDFYIFKSSDAL